MLNIKSVVPGDRPIIYIGSMYNAWKVLSLISTENTWITKAGIN